MHIMIGTAAWSGKKWGDGSSFYPPSCRSAAARLAHYAAFFSLVEVDSSYYAIPTPQTTAHWVSSTPAGFVLNVKAFRLLTGHSAELAVLPRELREACQAMPSKLYYADLTATARDDLWQHFQAALEPLKQAGRLGCVHFQFAPWVVYNAAGLAHVRECVARMQGDCVSLEFRHHSWFAPEHRAATLALERQAGAVHTVVDEPQGFVNTIPAVWEVTNEALSLVRLHGRNRHNWNGPSIDFAQRFAYDYSEPELAELLGSLRALAQRVNCIHVVFNNYPYDLGNALTLQKML